MANKHFKNPEDEYVQTDISLAELAHRWRGFKGCSYSNLCHRSASGAWAEARISFRRKVARKTEEKAVDFLADAKARQIEYYQSVQAKAMEVIEDPDERFEDIEAATRSLDTAIRGEAALRKGQIPGGMPEIHVHITGNGDDPKE